MLKNANVVEDLGEIDLLEKASARFGTRYLACDRKDRRPLLFGIVEAIQKVKRSRAHSPCTDAEATRDEGLSRRRIACNLLMADANPAELLLSAEAIEERVESVPSDAENMLCTDVLKD